MLKLNCNMITISDMIYIIMNYDFNFLSSILTLSPPAFFKTVASHRQHFCCIYTYIDHAHSYIYTHTYIYCTYSDWLVIGLSTTQLEVSVSVKASHVKALTDYFVPIRFKMVKTWSIYMIYIYDLHFLWSFHLCWSSCICTRKTWKSCNSFRACARAFLTLIHLEHGLL